GGRSWRFRRRRGPFCGVVACVRRRMPQARHNREVRPPANAPDWIIGERGEDPTLVFLGEWPAMDQLQRGLDGLPPDRVAAGAVGLVVLLPLVAFAWAAGHGPWRGGSIAAAV